MQVLLIVLGVVLIGLFVVWLQYNRQLKEITEVYEQVAEMEGGHVETGGLSLHPSIQLTHQGYPVTISHAYTGTPGAFTGTYTYAQFRHLPKAAFRFRLLPTERLADFALEAACKRIPTGHPALDAHLTLSTDNPEKAAALFTPAVVDVLLELISPETPLQLIDLHNFDERFCLAVADIPTQPAYYRELVEKAGILLEAYLGV